MPLLPRSCTSVPASTVVQPVSGGRGGERSQSVLSALETILVQGYVSAGRSSRPGAAGTIARRGTHAAGSDDVDQRKSKQCTSPAQFRELRYIKLTRLSIRRAYWLEPRSGVGKTTSDYHYATHWTDMDLKRFARRRLTRKAGARHDMSDSGLLEGRRGRGAIGKDLLSNTLECELSVSAKSL
ncbi:hypothetical protein R1flu_012439 [Riccia fluitans]|uniref:Uncharacterized protein n=1 Tax=Riccia fluitans TaxID=41844 RepID=A0ABD1ZER4_9MARC